MKPESYADMAKPLSGFWILLSSHIIAALVLVVALIDSPLFWMPIPYCLILPALYLSEIRRTAQLQWHM